MLGLGLSLTQPRRATAAGPAYLLRDTFTDANGTALASHTMDVGAGWTAHVGTWDIQGNAARNSPAANGILHANAGAADATASLSQPTVGTAINGGLIFRLVDASNYWLWTSGGTIYEVTAGGFTIRATAGRVPANGDVLGVTTLGTSITCKLNGVAVASYTSSQHQAGTRWGVRCNFDTAYRFDDFTVVP